MVRAETINRIIGFHGDGLPVLSLYGRIPPGASTREVIGESGLTRHVAADTGLSDYIVAAELRFPLPPPPAGGR